MIAAIIIARGGSVRLPRKNVLPFCGLPLVAWSVIQAKCSNLIDEVYVSTDDDEIADISEEHGATIIRRPDWPNPNELQGGVPIAHAIETILQARSDFDGYVAMFPTGPCRYPNDIDRIVQKWLDAGDERGNTVGLAPYRELCIWVRMDDGRCKWAMLDKTPGNWYAPMSGFNVHEPRKALVEVKAAPRTDAEQNDSFDTYEFNGYPDDRGVSWIECQFWQTIVDTDTAEDFELGEVLMEHYILQGRGPKVYYEYAGDYSHYIGNVRQL